MLAEIVICAHRPEFQESEWDSVFSNALLPEQNRPPGSQLDRYCNREKHRGQHGQQQQASRNIHASLQRSAQPVRLLALFEIRVEGWVAGTLRILPIPVIGKHVEGKLDLAELIGVEPAPQYRADPGKDGAEHCVVL